MVVHHYNLCANDNALGPVSDCRTFDFTLKFEAIILITLPITILCLFSLLTLRPLWLSQRCIKVQSTLFFAKLVVNSCFLASNISLAAVLMDDLGAQVSSWKIGLSFIVLEAFFLALLSLASHLYSVRPSTFLGLYLAITTLIQIVVLRSICLIEASRAAIAIASLSLALRLVANITENCSKAGILLEEYYNESTEESTAGFWSQALNLWLLPLFNAGYSRVLAVQDLAGFYNDAGNDEDAERLEANWKQHKSLWLATIITFRWQLAASVVPGLLRVAATLVQPQLINRFVAFTASYSTEDPSPAYIGWALAFSFFLVYFIRACAQGSYMILNIHLSTQFQGAAIRLLFQKSLSITSNNTETQSGKASTYMSVDVQKVCDMFRLVHDVWQNIIVIGIALWLLYREIGVAAIAVLGSAMISLLTPVFLGSRAMRENAAWTGRTEKRVALTTSFLQNIKALKLSAYESSVAIPALVAARQDELKQLAAWYKTILVAIFCGECQETLATTVGFTTYAYVHVRHGDVLDPQTTFTALSLIIILLQPLSLIMQNMSTIMAAFGGMQRLQAFLLIEDYADQADHRPDPAEQGGKTDVVTNVVELDVLEAAHSASVAAPTQLSLHDASFGWGTTSSEACIKNLSIEFPMRKLSMIIGQVGSGKTCLLHSILGETHLMSGSYQRPKLPIALCTQNAWIRNATLRSNIIMHEEYDQRWYQRVIQACDLNTDIALLSNGDLTLIGSKGQNLSGGQKQRVSLARALYSRASIYLLDDVFSAIDKGTEAHIFSALFSHKGLLRGKTVILVSHGIARLSSADHIILLSQGMVAEQGLWDDLKSKKDGIVASVLNSAGASQDEVQGQADSEPEKTETTEEQPTIPTAIQYERGLAVYKWYMSLVGYKSVLLALAAVCGFVLAPIAGQISLRAWSELPDEDAQRQIGKFVGLLWLFFAIFAVCWTLQLSIVCIIWSLRAGRKIHRTLLRGVFGTRLSFFDSNSVGFILNRFSQDIFGLDFDIPIALSNFLFGIIACLSYLGIVCVAVPWVTIGLPFMIVGLYFLQRYYLRTSRQVKTLALESKTPLFNSFLETMDGVLTIRAAKLEGACTRQNNAHVSNAQPTFFLQWAVVRAVTQILDLMTTFLVTCLAILAVAVRHTASAGLIGLAFLQIIQLQANLNILMIQFTNLETGMVAVERVKEFTKLEKEDPIPEAENPGWLRNGEIEYRNVCAKYADKEEAPQTLHDISFTIEAGTKIGICGRSGSGKSSLLLTLFRAMDYQTGQILIDGVDTMSLSLQSLRSQMTIVTQDPALWTGTIRDNLDPLHAATDLEIWAAINRVGIQDLVSKFEHGLDHFLENGALDFSAGQRQLLCLARACLRGSRIVVLDEATSNMDILTDQVVQEVIRDVFKHATVLTIAHRIGTIMDYDRIMILEAGRLVEFDTPAKLLARPDSRLVNMRARQTTAATDDVVVTAAEQTEIFEVTKT